MHERLRHTGLIAIKLRKTTYTQRRRNETDTGDWGIKAQGGPSRPTGLKQVFSLFVNVRSHVRFLINGGEV